MKFIHTADLHIGSKINVRINNLSSTIIQRVNNSLDELSQYAKNNDIEVIVIAGDLFDSKNMSIRIINSILNTINNYPNIYYLYALGNHDKVNFLSNFELPKNLIIFNKDYEMITIHDVNFIGINFYNDSVLDKYKNIPSLDSDKKNVLIIHGEIYSGDKIEAKKINLKKFIDKNINYLALGHIHMNSVNILDGNGVYVYPGCLFARGFDELGKKGFYLVDSLDLLHPTFITNDFLRPISFYKLDIDISKTKNNQEIIWLIKDKTKTLGTNLALSITLIGEYSEEVNKDINYILDFLKDDYLYLELKDESVLKFNIDKLKDEFSLKGEFIRKVFEEENDVNERNKIIEIALKEFKNR